MRDSPSLSLRDVAWSMLRVAVGAMFLTHGYAKIFGVTADGADRMLKFVGTVTALGLPFPEAFAWLAALAELLGGSLVVLGLFTRPASLFALATMIGAITHHWPEGFGGFEKALLFAVFFSAFLIGGAGRFSFDAVRQARKEKLSLSIFR